MVGTVYAKGSGVTADSRGVPLKEGDRITYTYFAGCMNCPHCMRGAVSSCASKRMFISEQPGEMRITCADISRAKERLGFAPKVDVEEGIQRFVAWYREQVNDG